LLVGVNYMARTACKTADGGPAIACQTKPYGLLDESGRIVGDAA
jgi:hypothetical protein